MTIEVHTTWMEHEGGTKFYQIFEFRNSDLGAKNVTMTHWGSIQKLHADKFNRPILGGETQIKPGRLASTSIATKRKRGYSVFDTRVTKGTDWWTEHFGAALTHELTVALGLVGAEEEPSDPVDTLFRAVKPPVPEAPRPETWGTW